MDAESLALAEVAALLAEAGGPACVAVAFGGGKDGLVVLDLVHRVLAAAEAEADPPLSPRPPPVAALALELGTKPWGPPLLRALCDTQQYYRNHGNHVHLALLPCASWSAGLHMYVRAEFQPALHTLFMGRRNADLPRGGGGALPATEACTAPYPTQVRRAYPIRAWTHGQVWAYIRARGLPVCSLYAEGHTSLGASAADSRPNPVLGGRPAWELRPEDADTERMERDMLTST